MRTGNNNTQTVAIEMTDLSNSPAKKPAQGNIVKAGTPTEETKTQTPPSQARNPNRIFVSNDNGVGAQSKNASHATEAENKKQSRPAHLNTNLEWALWC